MTSHFQPTTFSVHENTKNEVHRGLAMMIYEDLLPTTILDSHGLKHIFSQAVPWMNVPSRPFISEYINLLQRSVEQNLKKELDGQTIAITSDIWTSDAIEAYISVTGHYIDEDWNLQNILLGE